MLLSTVDDFSIHTHVVYVIKNQSLPKVQAD